MKINFKIILIVIAIIILLVWKVGKYNSTSGYQNIPGSTFTRDNAHLIFTKHARCRMACRDITQQEVKEILHDGNINYSKSEISDHESKYALEGYSDQHQHLRIILAPENDGMVVITCIDLDHEWPCNCN